MRRIDFWMGLPLTAIATGGHRLLNLLLPTRRPAPDQVRRILFIELSEMGSTILADPALRRAQMLYPQAELFFLIFTQNRTSLEILETIPPERILTIRADSLWHLAFDTLIVLRRLHALSMDMTVDLELFSRFTSLLSLFSGAPMRVGFHGFHNEGLYRGNHLTHPVLYNPHQHIAKNFLALVYAPMESPTVRPHTKRRFEDQDIKLVPYLLSPARQEAFSNRLLTQFPILKAANKWVILNPNASEMLPLRKWPLAYYGELAKRLLEDQDLVLLITGALQEKPDAQYLLATSKNERVVDLTGFTRLEDLPVLYTLCSAMLTNDSGPAHFAAPTGLRTFVLFGPETPALYGALNPNAEFFFKGLACSPCVSAANHRKSACTDNQCMKQISVDEVFERIRIFLDGLDTGKVISKSQERSQ